MHILHHVHKEKVLKELGVAYAGIQHYLLNFTRNLKLCYKREYGL